MAWEFVQGILSRGIIQGYCPSVIVQGNFVLLPFLYCLVEQARLPRQLSDSFYTISLTLYKFTYLFAVLPSSSNNKMVLFVDIDECQKSPMICGLNSVCTNTEPNFNCVCHLEYYSPSGSNMDCIRKSFSFLYLIWIAYVSHFLSNMDYIVMFLDI